MSATRKWVRDLAVAASLVLLLGTVCYLVFAKLHFQSNWAAVWRYRALFVEGWVTTVAIAGLALVSSTAIGALLVVARRCGIAPLRIAGRVYTELIRGTPLLVQILIGYYIVANALGLDSQILIGVVLLSAFAGAYLGEIFRGGIEGVGRSQFESARAVGFDRWQSYRYVILPQAVRRTLPAVTGQFVSLIKDSSLLSVIGIAELTQQARIANSATYSSLEGFIVLAIGYLALTLPLSWLATALECRFAYES
ncbi:amino acid ABC transporter permease [soil metagenome]